MAGGFIGVISFPTDEDAKKAKAKVEKQLAENLKAFSSNSIPENFIVLSDASKITINKIEIVEDINKEGKFSVYGEGQLKTIAFPKISFLELLQKKASDQIGFSVSLEENKLLFNNISTNIDSNSIFFNVDWNGVATRLIDDETIKQAIKGKNSADLKNYITSLDGVASAKISFWPFWVKKSPDNTSKINIEIVK